MNNSSITNKTHATKLKEQQPKWYIIDAKGQILGQVATKAALILMGKNKVNYVPYLDMGDHVVVINSFFVAVTGNKEEKKLYRRHSGYPGGFKELTYSQLKAKNPNEIIIKAIRGMLPRTRMGHAMIKKLHVFVDEKHAYPEQKFEKLI